MAYTYDGAVKLANLAVEHAGAITIADHWRIFEKLLARIEELERSAATSVPNGGFDAISVYLEAWQSAREHYGTTDLDGDEQNHGAECDKNQGPYRCTCDYDGQMAYAYTLALDYVRENK